MGWSTVRGTVASVQATKAYWEAEVYLLLFVTSTLEWDVCSSSCYGRFTPEKNVPGTHWTVGSVGTSSSLDSWENECVTPTGNQTPIPRIPLDVQPVA